MPMFISSKILIATALWAISSAVAYTGTGTQATTGASSIKKVIEMLTKMAAVGKKEMQSEQVEYAKFSEECSSSTAAYKKQIAKETENVELLTAEIGDLQVEIKGLGAEIETLKASEEQLSEDLKAQEKERSKAHASFLKEQTDYTESVHALEQAISVIQKQNYDRTGGESSALLQLQDEKSALPEQAKTLIGSFLSTLQTDDEEYSSAPPEANAYEFQSSGLLGVLSKLLDEFRGKLTECQQIEMNSVHAFNMVVNNLQDSIKNAQADATEKSTKKASREAKLNMEKKDASMSADVIDQTKKTLARKVTDCDDETVFYEDKQRVRSQELLAIAKAIEILQSEPMNTGEKYIGLNQVHSKAPVFAQLRSQSKAEGIHKQIRQFLEAEAKRLHSQRIALLAQKLAADPFSKVKQMIDDMITRLLEEANADADHKGFCDKEMGLSKVTRDKLSSNVDMLTSAAEDSKATIMSLKQEIAELYKDLALVQKTMTEAAAQRKEEKAASKVTIAEAKDAQNAVEAAMAVLKKFYEGALVPVPKSDPPDKKMGSPWWNRLANPNFDSSTIKKQPPSYTGQQEYVGGVFALLEVILSDFANVEAEATAEEATMQQKFEELYAQSEKSISVKYKKIDMNSADQAAAESALNSQTFDLKSTQDQLIAANKYHDRLVPQCVDQGMTFKERTAAREEEIASLKQALELLTARTTL